MRFRSVLFGLSALACLPLACASPAEDAASEDSDLTERAACTQDAVDANPTLAEIVKAEGGEVKGDAPVIANYTAWPEYGTQLGGAYDRSVVQAKKDPNEARENIAKRYGACAPKVKKHLETKKPNVYVYFTGFGGATQNNSVIDEGGILRWINKRDPKALIFSVNWSCADSHDSFCKDNAVKLKASENSPEYQTMAATVNAVAPKAMDTVKQILAATSANQEGYNTAMSHSIQLAALLVDQLLVADDDGSGKSLLGDIHFLGYSMGAHSASQVLVQDFVGDGSGFKWTRPGQCDNGKDACTVAHLTKVKWALSLGLSGWSEAMLAYNQTDAKGVSGRNAADIAQFQNGGLFRVKDSRFNNKSNVYNRRMDPTGNSDDTFQRGFGDIFFSDYNHYSHDYSLPLFVDTSFVRALDAFLEAPKVVDAPELGIIGDNAGLIDFDSCPKTGTCNATTGYLAHAMNRAHDKIGIPKTEAVPTTEGVKHPEKSNNVAVSFAASGAKPIAVRTFDQEDLRGGVELYYRPTFDPTASGTHGLFSYGSCGGSQDDLMPQAYLENGNIVFTMSYQGKQYSAVAPVSKASLKNGTWTHLSFTWDLPVVSIANVRSPDFANDAGKYGQAVALAAGLRKPLPTTYKKQQGQGELRIYANGSLVGNAPLGAADSQRECLSASQVLSTEPYSVNGETYPAFVPYARYDASSGDQVNAGTGSMGQKCKAYRVRNTQAFFGCAKSEGVNAQGDMDDITIVWGPGRAKYDNIDHASGAPKTWPIGVSYDDKAYVAR